MLSFGAAWFTLALFDFGYPVWFELLEIQNFIQELGPQNRHKYGFENLTPEEYKTLFSQINYAIHFDPNGLADITYTIPLPDDTSASISLLRPPEVIHLQDVAKLISFLKITTLLSLISYIYLLKTHRKSRKAGPANTVKPIAITWLIIGFLGSLVYIIEPTAFFYWLHDLVFPAENQWFFYYQDSLMTTLMKAPLLFGPIAITLLLVTLAFDALSQTLVVRLP